MKIYETSADIAELCQAKWEETSLPQMGMNLKIMSVVKGKDVLKVGRANATTEFLTKNSDIITLYVYEEAFERLSDEFKLKLMEGVLSNVSYDTEKDKLVVDNSRYGELLRMKRKYPNYCEIIETSVMVIDQIAEEERQRKEEEKARKAEERALNKRNN